MFPLFSHACDKTRFFRGLSVVTTDAPISPRFLLLMFIAHQVRHARKTAGSVSGRNWWLLSWLSATPGMATFMPPYSIARYDGGGMVLFH